MSTTMLRPDDLSPWWSWSLGSKDLGYSATGVGVSVSSASPSPNWVVATMLAALAATAGVTPTKAIESLVGTGGSWDSLVSEDRTDAVLAESWRGLFERFGKRVLDDVADVLTGSVLIAEIRATLGVSITDLASICGVSRQAVYDWIGGGQVSNSNLERLMELRRVCLNWQSLADRALGQLLRAKTTEGRSLLDLLIEDPLDRSLIQSHLEALAKRAAVEKSQREARRARLTPLREKDRYENTLVHAIPASHS